MATVETETSRLMVEYLKASTDVRKPIDSLNKVHLGALAEIARATYIGRLAERREAKEVLPDEVSEIQLWLI